MTTELLTEQTSNILEENPVLNVSSATQTDREIPAAYWEQGEPFKDEFCLRFFDCVFGSETSANDLPFVAAATATTGRQTNSPRNARLGFDGLLKLQLTTISCPPVRESCFFKDRFVGCWRSYDLRGDQFNALCDWSHRTLFVISEEGHDHAIRAAMGLARDSEIGLAVSNSNMDMLFFSNACVVRPYKTYSGDRNGFVAIGNNKLIQSLHSTVTNRLM